MTTRDSNWDDRVRYTIELTAIPATRRTPVWHYFVIGIAGLISVAVSVALIASTY